MVSWRKRNQEQRNKGLGIKGGDGCDGALTTIDLCISMVEIKSEFGASAEEKEKMK